MAAHPKGRFVKLRSGAGEAPRPYSVVYLAATEAPTIETHGLLADINKADPARAKLIEQRLGELVARNGAFLQWLEASAANAALFTEDPVRALREVFPDLPPDFFEGWKA